MNKEFDISLAVEFPKFTVQAESHSQAVDKALKQWVALNPEAFEIIQIETDTPFGDTGYIEIYANLGEKERENYL